MQFAARAPYALPLAAAAALYIAWRGLTSIARAPKRLPYPPGPKGLPLVGNLFDTPEENQWLTYTRWRDVYGDVVHREAMGQHIVVLNSLQAATDLLERRSTVYSSRPRSVMLNELMGFEWVFTFFPYGERLRAYRRALHPYASAGGVQQWEGIQLRAVRAMACRLLVDADDLTGRLRHLYGVIIMGIVYGIAVDDKNNPYTTVSEEAVDLIAKASLPGAYLVEIIPWLKYVPAWVPGAGFQRMAAHSRGVQRVMIERPFEAVKAALSRGEGCDCMVAQMLTKLPTGSDFTQDEIIKHVAGVAYMDGTDTSVSPATSFFLAMLAHPDVQRKAQEELDRVVGRERLPDFGDRSDLPYVTAVILEALRWQPVLPLGFPHATSRDDEYDGYLIPEGTVIVPNAWGMLHDPAVYPNPEQFMPERYLRADANGLYELSPDAQDPRVIAFGFGRRGCPGKAIAEQALFAIIATVLSVLMIEPVLDEQGVRTPPEVRMSTGLLSHPIPFKCDIKPRSKASEILLKESGPKFDASA